MPTILHVFEPRYRLMIRRCIESSTPRFGMVLPSRGTGPDHLQGVMEYGTMLEIQSVQMLPDGRSMVETVGSHRFRLMEKGSLDGYTVGRIERWVGCGAFLHQTGVASFARTHPAQYGQEDTPRTTWPGGLDVAFGGYAGVVRPSIMDSIV
jgi:hypothetical protein